MSNITMHADEVKIAQNLINSFTICIPEAEKVVEYLRSNRNHTLEECKRIAPNIDSFLDLDVMQKKLVNFIEMKNRWEKNWIF